MGLDSNGEAIELLKAAFHHNDAASLRQALARHPELKGRLNEPLFAFDSPPMTTVRSRAMLDVLLDAGADINARSRWWTGSFGLLDFADPELSAYAIERGATVTVHAAARLGMLDRLKAMIEAEPSLVHAPGGDGQTPLHFASTVEVAEYLLAHGADIDARDIDHESTPAQYMVRDRQVVARYLVARGCTIDILLAAVLGDLKRVRTLLDSDPSLVRVTVSEAYFPKRNPRSGGTIYIWTLGANKTPHRIAREFGHDEVFRLLMDRSHAEVKLAQACELGDEQTFDALLKSRPNLVASLTDAERRKLADAAQDNNLDAVRLMLSAGWPIDARGQHGATALHWAAWHGNAGLVNLILHHNPPLEDANNDYRSTPLGWAIHASENGWHPKAGDYPATVELLCAAGAKLPDQPAGTKAVKEVLRLYATK